MDNSAWALWQGRSILENWPVVEQKSKQGRCFGAIPGARMILTD
jgi:hypothetical protein